MSFPRTANVTFYNSAGTGSPVMATTAVRFPSKIGEKIWTPLGLSIGCHTFRLPFPDAEVYGIRFTAGIVNGPVRTGGVRFDHITVDFSGDVEVSSLTIRTDAGNPYLATSGGNALTIGGANGIGYRHQLAARSSLRVRFAINASMDTLLAAANALTGIRQMPAGMVRPGTRIAPGVDLPFTTQQRLTGGNLTSALANGFNAGRVGLFIPWGFNGTGNGEGGANRLDYSPGHEQSYELAEKRANGAADRHHVDCIDYQTGQPARSEQLTLVWGNFPYDCYGLSGAEEVALTRGGQLREFWASDPGGDANTPISLFWHNATAGTDENVMLGYLRQDMPHLRRVTAAMEGMAEVWGDAMAQFDLDMAGQDAEYLLSRFLIPFENDTIAAPGTGHYGLGARKYASGFDAMNASSLPHLKDAARRWADACARAQMPNGYVQRWPFNSGPNPSPWTDAGGANFPTNWDVQQTMEMSITSFSCARAGRVEVLIKQVLAQFVGGVNNGGASTDLPLVTLFGYIPKYVATGKRTQAEHRITSANLGGDYWPWMILAMGICLSPWKNYLINTIAPNLALPQSYAGQPTGVTLGGTLTALEDYSGMAGQEIVSIAAQALRYKTLPA